VLCCNPLRMPLTSSCLSQLMKARKVGPPSIWDKPLWPDPVLVVYNVEGISTAKVKPIGNEYATGSSKPAPAEKRELTTTERWRRFVWSSFEDSEGSVWVSSAYTSRSAHVHG